MWGNAVDDWVGRLAMGVVVATAGIAFAGEAWGSGFQLRENSASALGNAFAGAAASTEDQPARRWRHGGKRLDDAVHRRHSAGDRRAAEFGRDHRMGAAYIAGLARGLYPEPEALLEKWQPERRFAPQMPANEREERYAGWRRAVAGVLETVP